MKKIVLLLFLIPFIGLAKFYKATVTMNDGTLKSGFIALPSYPDDAKIKFRTEENGDTEKLSVDAVKGFDIILKDNQTYEYITMYTAYKGKGDYLKIDKKKCWVRIVEEGKINLCSTNSIGTAAMMGVPGSGISESITYYINRPGDDFAIYVTDIYGYGTTCVNCFSAFKKMIANIFEKDCPKLVDLIEKDDFKKNGYVRIVELYEQNCGK